MLKLTEIVEAWWGTYLSSFLLSLKYTLDNEVNMCNSHLDIEIYETGERLLEKISTSFENLNITVKHLDRSVYICPMSLFFHLLREAEGRILVNTLGYS